MRSGEREYNAPGNANQKGEYIQQLRGSSPADVPEDARSLALGPGRGNSRRLALRRYATKHGASDKIITALGPRSSASHMHTGTIEGCLLYKTTS